MKPFLAQAILAAMLVICPPEVASAASPSDPDAVFFSEDVLQGALKDIAKMQEAELRAFTHYLAECNRLDVPNSEPEHGCDAAYVSYKIEFGETKLGKTRPIDDILAARVLRVVLLHLEQTLHSAQSQLGKQVVPDRSPLDDLKKATQAGVVLSMLEDGARARFHALRAGQK
jgi:hypothetical protein